MQFKGSNSLFFKLALQQYTAITITVPNKLHQHMHAHFLIIFNHQNNYNINYPLTYIHKHTHI